jgi:hypothetical protein
MDHTEPKCCSLWNNVDSGRWVYFSSRLFTKIGALYTGGRKSRERIDSMGELERSVWEMAKPSGSRASAKEKATHRGHFAIASSYLLNLSLVSNRNFFLQSPSSLFSISYLGLSSASFSMPLWDFPFLDLIQSNFCKTKFA